MAELFQGIILLLSTKSERVVSAGWALVVHCPAVRLSRLKAEHQEVLVYPSNSSRSHVMLRLIPSVRSASSCACNAGLTHVTVTKSAEKWRAIPRACWKWSFYVCVCILHVSVKSYFANHEPLPNNDDNLNRLGNLPSLPWYSAILHMVGAIWSFPYIYIYTYSPIIS